MCPISPPRTESEKSCVSKLEIGGVIGKIPSNKIPTHPCNIPQIPLESKKENDSLQKHVVLNHPHIVLINTSSFFTFGPNFSPFFGVGFPYEKKNTSKNTCGKRG